MRKRFPSFPPACAAAAITWPSSAASAFGKSSIPRRFPGRPTRPRTEFGHISLRNWRTSLMQIDDGDRPVATAPTLAAGDTRLHTPWAWRLAILAVIGGLGMTAY